MQWDESLSIGNAILFWRAASDGTALGLSHRYEWLTLADRLLDQAGLIGADHPRRVALWEAFVAFERTIAASPEEHAHLTLLTRSDLMQRVIAFYAARPAARPRLAFAHQGAA